MLCGAESQHFSICPRSIASLVREQSCLMLRFLTLNVRGSCVSLCLCLHAQRNIFTSYSPTLSVPAIGLSHSHWPRCHRSLHPSKTYSRTSGPKTEEGWVVQKEEGSRAKAVLDVKRHVCLFLKTFSTVLTNAKWHHCHTRATSQVLLLALSKCCDSCRKCTLQRGANSLQTSNY